MNRLYWLAVVAALALFGGGLAVAYVGYAATSGPDGAVRGYYDALQQGDASRALAFGAVPAGPHSLLTSTVLAEQQRIAPITDFSIVSTTSHGANASVRVRYALEFPGSPQLQDDTVRVHRSDGSWHLVRTALATELELPAAQQRASVVGASVPQGTVLMFPGAVPVRFDSPYLRLDPSADTVTFASPSITDVVVAVSAAGKQAVYDAMSTTFRQCLSGRRPAASRCPQPTERYVPGTLRGTVMGSLVHGVSVRLAATDVGRLDISGQVSVRARFRVLTYANLVRSGAGRVEVPIHATAYAVQPLRVVWQRS